jgi:murein DD-endopeptidase MepM/ murein hydrolase activator NlpD
LKVTIINKAEITVKEKNAKYNVFITNLGKSPNLLQKFTIKKFKLNLAHSANEIHKAPVTQDMKRDLLSIVQMLKQEKFNVSALELVYEQQSTKNETLFYVDTYSGNAKVRVYKYKDKAGSTHYVKQNGMILSREKVIATSVFRLAYPIQNPVFGSAFGMRTHPIIRKVRMHHGVDFRAIKGTPILAPASGVIVEMTSGRGFGKHIRMRHNSTYTTLYAHLDNFAKDKRVGVKVTKGEVIGYVGKTGLATGEHLHFEVHENGRPINPFRLISNAAVPNSLDTKQLSQKQMSRFRTYQAEIDKKVKSL